MNHSISFILDTIKKIALKLEKTGILSFIEDSIDFDIKSKKINLTDLKKENLNTFIVIIKNIPIYTLIQNLDLEKDFLIINFNNNDISVGIKNLLKKNNIITLQINPYISILYKIKNSILLDFINKIDVFSTFSQTIKSEVDYNNYLKISNPKQELFQYDLRINNLYHELNSGKYKVLSIDFFDTLVFRLVSEPKAIFFSLYEKLLKEKLINDFYNKEEFMVIRGMAESEALKEKIKQNIFEVNINDIYQKLTNIITDIQKAKNIEIKTEIEYSFINPFLESLIKFAKTKSIKVIITSDMYLFQSDLKEILEKNNFNLELIDYIFVSSEHNASKRDKKIYHKILNYFNIKSNELIHIGDNISSDYENAISLGIKAYPYIDSEYLNQIKKRELFFNHNKLQNYSNFSLRKICSNIIINENENENLLFNIGSCTIAPFLSSYIYWVLAQAKKNNINTLLVLMREGELFSEMLKTTAKKLNYEFEIKTFYVSRLSTILPALSENYNKEDLSYLIRVLLYKNGYFEETISIFDKLGFENSQEILQKYQIPDKLELKDLNNFLNIFFENIEIKNKLKNIIKNKIDGFYSYFNNFAEDNIKNIALVDLGYSGSIQNFIKKILDSKNRELNLYGFYLLNNIGSMRRPLKKGSFYKSYFSETVFSSNLMMSYFNHLEILEKMISAVIGTTTDYESNFLGTNQILSEIPEIELEQHKITNKIKEGILFYHELYNSIVNKTNNSFYHDNIHIISRFHALPNEKELKALESLTHFDQVLGYNTKLTGDEEIINAYKKDGIKVLDINNFTYWKDTIIRNYWVQSVIQKDNYKKLDELIDEFLIYKLM
ncbi:MAG: HAD-IA family hydrolase [Candidatus Sericytochromatia bacterium]